MPDKRANAVKKARMRPRANESKVSGTVNITPAFTSGQNESAKMPAMRAVRSSANILVHLSIWIHPVQTIFARFSNTCRPLSYPQAPCLPLVQGLHFLYGIKFRFPSLFFV